MIEAFLDGVQIGLVLLGMAMLILYFKHTGGCCGSTKDISKRRR